MRLRPSGKSGPVTIAFDRFASYQQEQAWTWEHMALIRARVITGFRHESLTEQITSCLSGLMKMPRDKAKVIQDAKDMRQRITTHNPPRSSHDLRLIPGGLIDMDFFAQIMQLLHPCPDGRRYGQAIDAITALTRRGVISSADEQTLKSAMTVLLDLNQIMRLVITGVHDQHPDAMLPQPIAERFGITTIADMDHMVKTHADTIIAVTNRYMEMPDNRKV
jgi:glutamate-ammonia-ligase adenylyltransferase